ncbi:MAG TPA: GAF domain-containing protein [Polyangiaceae bacterium]|nr:GAF domain-containing protein [Polyangiaceae bacterium]
MAALSLDLTPVINGLLERPFDHQALERARMAVGGHPHAYATALRCAAKRTHHALAAAYWLTEAARVHESVEDIGGAIALLSRAWQADPSSAHTKEMLAGCMARLSVRVGLGFVVLATPPSTQPKEDDRQTPPARHESGLRPPPLDADAEPRRDTLPDLFASVAPLPAVEKTKRISIEADDDAPESIKPALTESAVVLRPGIVGSRETIMPPPDTAGMDSDFPEGPVTLEGVLVGPESTSGDVYGEREDPPTVRPAGDRLVGALFEALHALHFMDEVRDGATFVQGVIASQIRPRAILVHLYDINQREFVIVAASGARTAALIDFQTADSDALVEDVMKGAEALLVLDPTTDPRLAKGRWLLVEPKQSVLCAPVVSEGRYLGLLEIADPIDGAEFTEDDRNALTYVASAFARFLVGRGVVLSEDATGSDGE